MAEFDKYEMLTRVNKLCADMGIKPTEAFTRMNMKTSHSDWKQKASNPSLEALLKMSEFFNVSLDYLVYGDEMKAPVHQEVVTPQDRQLIDKLSELPYESRAVLNAYLDGLLQMYKMKK